MNNKGINNIVLVVLIVLIVIAGVTLIWTYAGNTLHRGGKSIEEAGTFTGAGGKSTGEDNSDGDGSSFDDFNSECKVLDIYWYSNGTKNVKKVVEGEDVSLVVKGENCGGKNVTISIFESDGCGFGWCLIEFIKNYSVNFEEDDKIVDVSWNAEWMYDSWIGGGPEYYFTIKVGDKEEIRSDSLSVEKVEGANSPPSEDCKAIYYNEGKKIDIVIFADGETAKKYADALIGFYPMSQYKNAFNLYYIDDYPTKDACEIYKGIAMLCRSIGLINRASRSCPNDYIIVVQSHPSEIRSSAYSNIMSINSNLPKSVVQHEFGHVFALLAEEYVPAIIPKDAKNCAEDLNTDPVVDCDRQFGERVGIDRDSCWVECSDKDYRRSIESGIMRTLSSDKYGIFNDNLIIERLKKFADLSNVQGAGNVQNIQGSPSAKLSPPSCADQEYYLVKGIYDVGKRDIDLIRVDTHKGCADEDSNGYGGAKLEVLNEETNDIIGESRFSPELIFTTDGRNPEKEIVGETFVNEGPVYLKVPKSEGQEIEKVRIIMGEKVKQYKIESQGIEKSGKIMEVAY